MLVGGDLGISYLVLMVSLVGPVIFFVVRRKWRLSVARKEEIQRLLILASEEAARAELETTAGYVSSPPLISRPLPYQCAVCFAPTTRRCARCRAVRYCSGRCQIIHWRQGHKEECHSSTSSHKNNDVGGSSSRNALKQVDLDDCRHNFETEGPQHSTSVTNFPEESALSNLSSSPEVSCQSDVSELEIIATRETAESNSKRPSGYKPHGNVSGKAESTSGNGGGRHEPPSLEITTLADSAGHFTGSGKLNQQKPRIIYSNRQNRSSSSTVWSGNGFNESPFSEPSMPSSDVWDGAINSTRTRIDAPEDSAQCRSRGDGDGDVSYFPQTTSFQLDKNVDPPLVTEASDNAALNPSGIKKPVDRLAFSEDIPRYASKAISSQSPSPRTSNHLNVRAEGDSHTFKATESGHSLVNASYTSSTMCDGAPPTTRIHAKEANSMQSLRPGMSNHLVHGPSSTLHRLASNSGGGGTISARTSNVRLSSSNAGSSLESSKSKKVNSPDVAAASYSQSTDYSSDTKNGLKTSVLKVVEQLASKSSQPYLSGVRSEIDGGHNKGLFSYDLFVKLYNWNKVELRPCGLRNCGNSCYANAVLQCLAFTPPLTAYFLQGIHSKSCQKKEWCFTCELQSLILKTKEGTSPLSPTGILAHIQSIGSKLANGREEDAHEFLRYAIDTMQSVCLKEAGANASCSMEETTLIGLTFGGYLRSKIKCMKCGNKSERHERMMDLTVEIEGDIGTLEEALQQFTSTEILDGENKYQCSRCKSYEKARKKLRVFEAPNVLTIALKRFQSGKFGKISKSICFPEILDLARYTSGTSDKSPIYRLYGVVVHLDIMNATFSGHYVCYVKNVQNKWFKIDDSMVKAVELESVLTKGAYMLLYARCSPRAPRLIRNSTMLHDSRKAKFHTSKPICHLIGPCDTSKCHLSNIRASSESCPSRSGLYPSRPILEEDSSSDNSSSIFSEECSCSTESSNVDSTSSDDITGHVLGDLGCFWNSPWRNSSDSDSSSSTSSSSPLPLYSRHSLLANTNRYASENCGTNAFTIQESESGIEGSDFGVRMPGRSNDWEGDAIDPFWYSETSKQCRKLASRNSRETDSDRLLGRANPRDNQKDGVSFTKSMR